MIHHTRSPPCDTALPLPEARERRSRSFRKVAIADRLQEKLRHEAASLASAGLTVSPSFLRSQDKIASSVMIPQKTCSRRLSRCPEAPYSCQNSWRCFPKDECSRTHEHFEAETSSKCVPRNSYKHITSPIKFPLNASFVLVNESRCFISPGLAWGR